MEKERILTFFDAVLAIIMTILVLDLEPPEVSTWANLWAMRQHFFAYAIGFLILGTMWVQQVQAWQKVKFASTACMWACLFVLFVSSLIPFATSWISDAMDETVPALFYMGVSIALTVSNLVMYKTMEKANPENPEFHHLVSIRSGWLIVDLIIKAVGVVVAMMFPSWTLIIVLIASVYVIFANWHHKRKIQRTH